MSRWDEHFLSLAMEVAKMSKDPRTKVGAVIVDQQRRIVGTGYNGFPRGVPDKPEHYEDPAVKYKLVVHAELNAILNANQLVKNCAIYCTFHPCAQCAAAIIQAGIRAVFWIPSPRDEAWKEDQELAKYMLKEAGIESYRMRDEPPA